MKAKRKKRIYIPFSRLVLICFLFLTASPKAVTADSQFPDFYYYFDKKVQLDVSVETITACFEDTVSSEQRDAVISSEPALKDISPKRLTSRLVSLAAKEELSINDILQAVERLNKLPEVKYAAPVFKYRDKELVLTDEFVARFKSDITEQQIRQLNTEYGVEIVRASPYRHNRYVLRVINPKTRTAIEVANTYNENPDVMYATPDFMVVGGFLGSYPDDTYFAEQWSLDNTGQNPPAGTPDADIDAPEGWDIETGDSDIIIAVLDSGVDYNHIDLSDNMWVNEAELNGDPCFDDDDNGYKDDIYGYDFCSPHHPPPNEDGDPMDDYGHGTACAGIIGAIGDNSEGASGVCRGCKIMAVKIGDIMVISNEAEGVDYACANGADILSCSWGVPPNSDLTDAVENAKTNGRGGKGCVIVCASGNDNNSSIAYPAIRDETIAVGATDHNDERWKDVLVVDEYKGSCYGSELNVVAPSGWGVPGGVPLWTTDITGSGGYNWGSTSLGDDEGNYSKWFGGTSGAAPHVAGLAGLILSVNPYLTSNEVQEIIETTADDKGDSGWDQYYGWGRINLHKALVEVSLLRISVDDGLGPDDCVVPGDYIEYVISYSNPVTDPNAPGYVGDANDVVIINHLQTEEAVPADPNAVAPPPVGIVDFIYADPNTGYYDPNDRTYTWDIGILSPGEGGTLVLVVQVNETVEPLSEIVNEVERISSEVQYSSWATEETSVCCFGGQVIYVDGSVVDANDGSSWNEAFDKLDNALAIASICDEIWVADGEYKPTTEPYDTDATFQMVSGIGLYGGFEGGEEERYERDWGDPCKETILSGDIDSYDDEPNRVDYVVVSDVAGSVSVLDGFTITGGSIAGVYCENSSPLIQHNKIMSSEVGIYCNGTAQPIIKNNWIYSNDYGIYFEQAEDAAVVRNNTVVYNDEVGIYLQNGMEPGITNCILWGNGDESLYPVTVNTETLNLHVPHYGPVGIAASMDLGLDLGISSCYNKIILLSGKMLGIRETFERGRSKS